MQVLVMMSTLGRFSNDGGDDKENAKKATSFKKHNNNFNLAVNFLVNRQNANSFQTFFRGGSRIFLGGGGLVSCSTSTPIKHIVFFFFAQYQLY